MRKLLAISAVLILLGTAGSVYAELQTVEVGGQLEIRGRWYHNAFETGNGPAASPTPQVRIAPGVLSGRVTGQTGNSVLSLFRYSDWGSDWKFFEQTTSLNVKASFTDNVSAFIELYDFAVWGEDFRSNYINGLDNSAATGDDVEILKSYIQVD